MLQEANKNPLIVGRCWSQNLSTNPGDAIPEYHDLLSGALWGLECHTLTFQGSKQIASRKQVKRKIGQSSTQKCIFVGICWEPLEASHFHFENHSLGFSFLFSLGWPSWVIRKAKRQVEMLKMEGFFFKQTDANWECLVNFVLSHKVFCRWWFSILYVHP